MRSSIGASAAGAALAALAAISASYLSGLSFPEQNNVWTIPVVLDFAGSAEGPHDPYHASFVRFVSLFWLAVRPFATEATVQPIYLALQLAGNALVALALHQLVRRAAGPPARSGVTSALVVAFLCFCYGLWGATRLGYSELFSTYATHTQYAVVLCLGGLGLIAARRPGGAGAVIGVAAGANLFMGVWGALAGGLALLADDRRLASAAQLRFAGAFLVLATPVAWWALASGGGEGAPPIWFFRTLAKGHIYAGPYPQATVQAFALGVAATLATALAPGEALRRLGLVTGAAFATLGVAAAMPYVAELPVLLLLHPLRFVSVTTLLTAACAGALLVRALHDDDDARTLPAFIAVAGFMLKLPVVSLFGFALTIPVAATRARLIGVAVAVLGAGATVLPTPIGETPLKASLGFLVMAVALAAAAWRRPDVQAPARLLIAGALGASVVTLPSATADAAALVAAAGAAACLAPARARWSIALALLSIALSIGAAMAEPLRAGVIALGALTLALAPLAPMRTRADAALIGLVLLLVLAGLGRGALAGFGPLQDARHRDWAAAQAWARVHTPPDALFLPIDVDQGFALFARRPIWWEETQTASAFWRPSLLPLLQSRRNALAAARTPAARIGLARRAGVDYLLLPADAARGYPADEVRTVFRNDHYVIARTLDPRGSPGDRP